jgi:hypothetical protein
VRIPLTSKKYFYIARVDEKWVLVSSNTNAKVLAGFAGELKGAPDNVVAELGKEFGPIEWMVDTDSNYKVPGFWSGVGLLVLLIVGVQLPSLMTQTRGGPAQSPRFAHLKSMGPVTSVLSRAEREINTFGGSARVSKLWITPQWIVSLDPALIVVPAAALVAAGPIVEIDEKTKEIKRAGIGLWTTFQADRLSVWTEGLAFADVAVAVKERLAWAWVPETGPFGDRWKGDRQGCIREAQSRLAAQRKKDAVPA